MLNDYEQHNDCPEEVFGDRTASDACDDAAAIITELLAALQALTSTSRTFRNVPKDEQEWGPMDDEALEAAFSVIAKATGEEA